MIFEQGINKCVTKTQLRIQPRRSFSGSLQPDWRILLRSSFLKPPRQRRRKTSPARILPRSHNKQVVEVRTVSQLFSLQRRDRGFKLAQHAIAAREAQLPQHLEEAGGYEGPWVVDALAWWEDDGGGGPVGGFFEDGGVQGGGGCEAREVLAEVVVSLLGGEAAEHVGDDWVVAEGSLV